MPYFLRKIKVKRNKECCQLQFCLVLLRLRSVDEFSGISVTSDTGEMLIHKVVNS